MVRHPSVSKEADIAGDSPYTLLKVLLWWTQAHSSTSSTSMPTLDKVHASHNTGRSGMLPLESAGSVSHPKHHMRLQSSAETQTCATATL